MENVQIQPDYPRGVTFEQVWAALMENREQLKENAQEMKENAREMKETQKETDRQIKDINKRFGEFTNRFGEVVEYMVAPNLWEKFNEFGFDFQSSSNNAKFIDKKNDIRFEIDVFLQNSEKAMLVEVKTKASADDVAAHVERLKKMRRYADFHNDKRAFYGAVAVAVMTDELRDSILAQGLYAIEPSGDNFNIIPPGGNPKEW